MLPDGKRSCRSRPIWSPGVPGGEPVRDNWEAHEHDLVDDMRWWTLADRAACEERVFPERMLELLPDVAAGRYPDEVMDITVKRTSGADPSQSPMTWIPDCAGMTGGRNRNPMGAFTGG